MKDNIVKLLTKMNDPEKGISRLGVIPAYADRLLKNAAIVTYYEHQELVGFIGYYKNDLITKTAFLSMLVLDEKFQGRGIGKNLLQFSIDDVKKQGFTSYGLEVLKSNSKAIKLYKSLKFEITADRNEVWLMEMKFEDAGIR